MARKHTARPMEPDNKDVVRVQLQFHGDIARLLRQIAEFSGEDTANVAKRLIGTGVRTEENQINRRVA